MKVRQATSSDLAEIERLRIATFSSDPVSVWYGVPPEVQLGVRLEIWRSTGYLLEGLLVCTDDENIVGTVSFETRQLRWRMSPAQVWALRRVGVWRTVRLLTRWVLSFNTPAPDEAHFTNIAVRTDYRRRAAARAMTIAAEERARASGKRIASVHIADTNTASQRLASSLGYEFVGDCRRTRLRRLLRSNVTFLRAEKEL